MNDQLLRELGELFDRADRVLFLVGGSVRDKVLGRQPKDWDFATDALPEEIKGIVGRPSQHGWADAIWTVGERFGTIAIRKGGVDIEITTFRADGPGRKPEVTFTDSLEEDLARRDFTINAMAIRVDARGLDADVVDPFGGLTAIQERLIDTPRSAEESFSDDPLRMLRAARFAAQLSFSPVRRVVTAMHGLRERLAEISAERVQAELDKILSSPNPEVGLDTLWRTRVLEVALPGVQWSPSWDLLRGDDADTRWASLLQTLQPQDAQAKLMDLRFSNERRQRIVNLVAWQRKWHAVDWFKADDALIRTVIAQSGPEFLRLVKLLRSSDWLLPRANALVQTEGVPVPPLSGKEVMLAAGLKPGPKVGAAMQHLWELTLQRGPMAKDEAVRELIAWA